MTDPIVFETATPRFGLPLLFAGQAQKEAFVNEAHAIADGLLHCAISGEASAPPAIPQDGTAWLVGAAATGDWTGQDGRIALRQSGNWLFVDPRDGMRVLDNSTGQELRYRSGWQAPVAPAEPSGGSVVDIEARLAIVALVQALRIAGVFAES